MFPFGNIESIDASSWKSKEIFPFGNFSAFQTTLGGAVIFRLTAIMDSYDAT